MKKRGIAIIWVAAIIVVVGFAPLMDVPYQVTQTYYESEPYVPPDYTTYGTPQNPIIAIRSVSSHTFSFAPNCSGVYYFAFDRSCKKVAGIRLNAELEWQETIGEGHTEVSEQTLTQQRNTPLINQGISVGQSVATRQAYIDVDGKSNCLVKGQFTVSAAYCPEVDFYVYDETDPSLDEVTTYEDATKYRLVARHRTVTDYRKGSIYEYIRSRF
ncbi:MAG: hypothetical protein JSW22_04395 [Chloroflexota bacterium]|nr:MAG: hypothetical protein JSW22_04395 [Chloroflexota bacterium]